MRTGQPLSGPVELAFGASSTTTKPEAGNEMKALEIPTTQMRGELRVRLGKRGEIAAIHERAIGAPTKIDPTQADTKTGQPWSAGIATRFAITTDGAPWAIGLDFELLRWDVPYTEYRTCIENCENVDNYQVIHSTTGQMMFGAGITPSYRFGHWSVFGGVYMQNHPTITRKETELFEENDEDLQGGPMNVLLHAGVAARMGMFTVLANVQQDLDRDPVHYGPSIGLALSATIDPIVRPTKTIDPEPNYAPPSQTPSSYQTEAHPPTYEEQY